MNEYIKLIIFNVIMIFLSLKFKKYNNNIICIFIIIYVII